jgi:ubiquinone/menaquinone biosynthesis C-methylase UbiE
MHEVTMTASNTVRTTDMNSYQAFDSAAGGANTVQEPSFPEIYEQILVGPLFQPWVDTLLENVGLEPGDRVLDVACGTGVLARIAKERLKPPGKVVGVDVNPQMLAVARRMAPTIEWREGDAAAIPLRVEEQFDVVLCQQGFQFFPDQGAAARQMFHALAGGGRLGVSTWRPDEEFPVLHQLRIVAEQLVGPIRDRRHSCGDPGSLEAALREAGFRDIRSKRLVRTIRFVDGNTFVRLNAMALVGMSAQAASLGYTERQSMIEAIAGDSAEILRRHSDPGGFSFDIGTNLTLAKRSIS